jgi:hypothetical protein
MSPVTDQIFYIGLGLIVLGLFIFSSGAFAFDWFQKSWFSNFLFARDGGGGIRLPASPFLRKAYNHVPFFETKSKAVFYLGCAIFLCGRLLYL